MLLVRCFGDVLLLTGPARDDVEGHGLQWLGLEVDSQPIPFQARILLGSDKKEADQMKGKLVHVYRNCLQGLLNAGHCFDIRNGPNSARKGYQEVAHVEVLWHCSNLIIIEHLYPNLRG